MICVIPSAGKGTRFRELGKQYPKCLLPIENKPIIQHNIERLYEKVSSFKIIVQPKDLDTFKDILSMYDTFDKIEFLHPDESTSSGPLTSLASACPVQEDVLIVLSDIILPNLPEDTFDEYFVSWEAVRDWERWCLVEDYPSGLKFFDKPKERPNVDILKALNGMYYVCAQAYNRIEYIIRQEFENETQISFWLSAEKGIKAKPINVQDVGTLDEYLKGRKNQTRYFNQIKKSGNLVFKSSSEPNKLFSEFSWFQLLPQSLKPFTARTFDFEDGSYSMENVSSPTLREHMLFLGLEENFDSLLKEIKKFIFIEKEFKVEYDFYSEIAKKTASRMKSAGFSDTQILKVIGRLKVYQKIINENVSIMHGDTVASNIFWDPLNQEIKLIDPRGQMYGSYLYDLAKLNQSMSTPYDYIDSGLHANEYVYQKSKNKYLQKWNDFLDENFSEYRELIDILTLSLMCSLIPLHKDAPENQKLYKKWCEERI